MKILTKRGIAAHFVVCLRTIDTWLKLPVPLPSIRIGGVLRFDEQECDNWFRQHGR